MQVVNACLRALLLSCAVLLAGCSGGGGGGSNGSASGSSATLNSGNVDAFVSETELAVLIGATAQTAFVSVQQTSPTTLTATQQVFCQGNNGQGTASYSLSTDASGNVSGTGS
jgi:hypothetical protein